MKNKVLFLCTHNSCRSQMAEGYLRSLAGGMYDVYSAGTSPDSIHPKAVQVMREDRIDIGHQTPTDIKAYLGKFRFDTVIVVCELAHRECPRLFPGTYQDIVYWPLEDPAQAKGTESEQLKKFREVRDQIKEKIRNWLHAAEE